MTKKIKTVLVKTTTTTTTNRPKVDYKGQANTNKRVGAESTKGVKTGTRPKK